MKKQNIMPSLVLGCICLVVALLLSGVNMITAPIIEAAQNAAANEALLEVLPDGKDFKELTIDEKYPAVINMGYKAEGGYVFRASVTGKSSGLVIMIGVSEDGKIVGTKVIADQETDSYDANVFPAVEGLDGAYKDMNYDGFEPYLVSGATLTSAAYGEAVKAALQAYIVASGGSVDVRTPEQILQDNCNAALGTTEVVFTKLFEVEVLDGIDAVYEAEGNVGRVYVIGEVFVGIKADGSVVNSDAGADEVAKATAANEIILASTLTEVTELPEGISSTITKISVTASGNYVFEMKAHGFSEHIYGEYGSGANLPISIKVSISADGKIIDCLTLEHDETKGYGDKCTTEEYYESWRDVTADKVVISNGPIDKENTDPGAIAGATHTTQGYQKAIKNAFAAFELLKGGIQNG